jgi:hypothetical protein
MIHSLFLLSFSLKTAFLCILGFEFHECCKLSFACTLCGHTIHWRRWLYSIINGAYSQSFKSISLARNTHTHTHTHTHIYIYIYIYTGCPGRKGHNLGRVFLMLKYTDITQNTYYPKLIGYGDNGQRKVWSCLGFHALYLSAEVLSASSPWVRFCNPSAQLTLAVTACVLLSGWRQRWHSCAIYSASNHTDNYGIIASVFVVQFNGFMSLIC